MSLERDKIDLWKLEVLTELGFSGDQVTALLFWNVDLHDVWRLMGTRPGATTCTHEQALRILKPLDVFALESEEARSERVPV